MRRGVLCAGLAVICLPPVSGAQSLMLTESEALARLSVDGPRVRAVRAPIQVAQADTQAAISRTVRLPQGYRIEYGGQFESQQSASRRLVVLGVGITIGVFMLLVLAFGRPRDALLVMLNLPLALIGGVAGVYLAGGVLSVASMIGFITLFGIATRNGIMLVSHIQHLMEEEGVTDLRQAVERAAHERVVPILMTAMAAGLALIPLALAAGESGSEIQTPMAIVILCGLATSTLLNMFVVPTLYLKYGRQ